MDSHIKLLKTGDLVVGLISLYLVNPRHGKHWIARYIIHVRDVVATPRG